MKVASGEINTHLKMEQSIKDNGKIISVMVTEFNYGQMVPNTKECGKTTKHMEKAHSNLFRDTGMKEIGREIRHMVSENIFMIMELLMKALGRMISNTAWALNFGTIILSTQDSITKAKNKEKEPTLGMMAPSI